MRDKGRGAPQHGEHNPMSRLDATKVSAIREMAARGVSQTEIGRIFNATQSNVSMVVNKVTWSHV